MEVEHLGTEPPRIAAVEGDALADAPHQTCVGQRGTHVPGADDRNLRGTSASGRRRVGTSGSPSASRVVAFSTVDWTRGWLHHLIPDYLIPAGRNGA
jgi:hypothetical protein